MWAAQPFSKKVLGRIPLVRSIIWDGKIKSRGLISSRREPTAEKAMIASTPMDFKAAILALAGTSDGFKWWPVPWRARKPTWLPAAVSQITILALGLPHGYIYT